MSFFTRISVLLLLVANVFADGLPPGQSVWSGRYEYPDGRPGVPFTLTINTSGNSFAGGTSEPATFGDGSSPTLTANVSGSVSGSSVQFTKTMDGSGGQHHSIQYSGTLSADGRGLSGKWSIGPTWSGPFSAQLVSGAVADQCQVCEQALANDVLMGIDSSGMPDTYVSQSLAKYDNCARRQPQQCEQKCARILRDTVQNCFGKFDSNGFKACERSGIDGFRQNVASTCTH